MHDNSTDMVGWNLCQAYLLEAGMTRIPANQEALVLVCHVGIHVIYLSMIFCLDP